MAVFSPGMGVVADVNSGATLRAILDAPLQDGRKPGSLTTLLAGDFDRLVSLPGVRARPSRGFGGVPRVGASLDIPMLHLGCPPRGHPPFGATQHILVEYRLGAVGVDS